MFNPLGAGFRWAVEIPKTKPGDTVVIMGPGQRGLSSVIAARQAGAKKIIVTGLTLAFGDTSGGFRSLIQIVFGLSIAFAASSFFLSFFSFGGGALIA